MAWMTVIEGAAGIGWFPIAFNPFRWTNMTPEQQRATERTNRQMTALAPVILDRAATVPVEVSGNICASARAVDGATYIFAVSLDTEKPTTATVKVRGLKGEAAVADEDRVIRVIDGAVTDEFAPLAVHVYVAR